MRRAVSIDSERSTGDLVRAITSDTADLVRKEVQLAKQEIVEALTDRVKAVAAIAVAGLLALFSFTFVALAAADGLATTMPRWAGRLITAAVFAALASVTLGTAKRIRKHPIVPEETARTIKEDVRWARQQLKR